MAITAAQMAAHLYPDKEDPEGAFQWWLNPCGGSSLVPDEIKKVFGILSQVTGGVSSFKPPKKIPKGSGKKGDEGNPRDRGPPRTSGSKPPTKPKNSKNGGGVTKTKRCSIPRPRETFRINGNTLRSQTCVGTETVKNDMVITSIAYAPNAKPLQVKGHCENKWSQACYHYSSAIRLHPQWSTITCPEEAATEKHRKDASAVVTWSAQHKGSGWTSEKNRALKACDRDE